MRLILILSVIIALVLAGCLDTDYSKEFTPKQKALLDYGAFGVCKEGVCRAFVCANNTNVLCKGWDFAGFSCPFRSLRGGNCSFYQFKDGQAFEDFSKGLQGDSSLKNKLGFRGFMVGMGSTFGDFANANRYCSNRLDMTVKWLVGNKTVVYQAPDAARAGCFLGENVIPLYILYSDSKNVDVVQSEKIAKTLAGTVPGGERVGPAIITSEMDFDSSDIKVKDAVKAQVIAMRKACKDCIIALAPKMGDADGLALLDDQNVRDSVDIVAYGINSRAYKGACNNPANIFEAARLFSSDSLYKYGKPTLIAYMLFDNSTTEGKCNWINDVLNNPGGSNPYSYFFSSGIFFLSQRGVIGAAPYMYNTSIVNPLKCESCGLGVNDSRFKSFFSWCQTYKTDVQGKPTIGVLGVFSNESGGSCSYAFNPEHLFRTTFVNGDLDTPITPKLRDPEANAWTCEACLNNNATEKFPTYVGTVSLPGVASVSTALGPSTDVCSVYPEIDGLIEQSATLEPGFDPMLVRAVMWAESDFDPCSASNVPESICKTDKYCIGNRDKESNPGSHPPDTKAIIAIDGVKYNTSHCNEARDKYNEQLPPLLAPNDRYFALGVMQVAYTGTGELALPSYVYSDYYSETVPADELACGDGKKYNPFNATHNICLGVRTLADFIKQGDAFVSSHKADLNVKNDTHQKVLGAYMGLHFYNQGIGAAKPRVEKWISDFNNRRKSGGVEIDETYCSVHSGEEGCTSDGRPDVDHCRGIQDFVQFVKLCIPITDDSPVPFTKADSNNYDYGYKILVHYRALTEKCPNSSCPAPLPVRERVDEMRKKGII
jgi:hypothetical protein